MFPLLVLDFETAAIGPRPKEYPPKPVSFAYKLGSAKSEFVSWGHPGKNSHTFTQAQALLQTLLSKTSGVVCHNANFDREVCQVYMKLDYEGAWHDTMILAFLNDPHGPLSLKPLAERDLNLPPEEQDAVREWLIANGVVRRSQRDWGAYINQAPAEIVGSYAIGDVDRTYKLFKLYAMLHKSEAYLRELELSPSVIDMERRGVLLDLGKLEKDVFNYQRLFKQLDDVLSKRLGVTPADMDADQTVATALKKKGLLSHDLPLTDKGAISVSKHALIECVKDKNLLGTFLMRNALATTLRTFMLPWLEQAHRNKGRLFFKFNQVRNDTGFGARTGRMSSSPSMMNVPSEWEVLYGTLDKIGFKRKFDLPNMRVYILPDPGCKIAALDYSQQEMRLFAHFEDGELMRAYQKDPTIDAHEMVAKISGLTRKIAKTLNFAALYGAGLGVVMQWLDCTQQEAASFRNQYRAALPGVKELSDSIDAQVKSGKPITTIGGRDYYPEPPKYVKGVLRSFVYKLLNYLMQGSAADQTKQAIIDYYKHPKRRGRVMFSVHDELVLSVPTAFLESDIAIMRKCMEESFSKDLDVKFLVDVETGDNYALN